MRVKIGMKVYDGNHVPIIVELTEEDKQNIASMLPHCTKYCQFPDKLSHYEFYSWMNDGEQL